MTDADTAIAATEAPDATGRRRVPFDLVTVLGLASGLGLMAVAMSLGGSLRAFIDVPSILIVLGGTASVTVASFSLADIRGSGRAIVKALTARGESAALTARRVLQLAEYARKNTILHLQAVVDTARPEPLLFNGLSLVVDAVDSDQIETILAKDIEATAHRNAQAANILHKAADVAPAMGLIGTLIGLVQMLGNLNDPGSIGPSMAVALITTFYGAILANMVFAPLAAKLERASGEELLLAQINLLGVMSIARQENPRRLEMLLNSVLPPGQRVRYFD